MDLAIANSEGLFVHPTIVIRLGNGDGTFQEPLEFRSPDGPNAIVAADFNHDTLVTPDDLSDYIIAYFNQPPDPAADFNGDGVINPDDLSDYINVFFDGCL